MMPKFYNIISPQIFTDFSQTFKVCAHNIKYALLVLFACVFGIQREPLVRGLLTGQLNFTRIELSNIVDIKKPHWLAWAAEFCCW